MMVTPEACSVRTTSHMPLRNSTSTPAVGSSRNRICGSCDSAFAIITWRFMRHKSDQRARRAIFLVDIVAIDGDVAFARIGDAADDADQRGLAGAVRPEQRKNLAALDFQVDAIQRLEAGAIDLRQIGDGNDG